MNTIKIPVKVTTVEETFVEVELPCYTRVNNTFYFVLNENKGVDVYLSPSGSAIISNTIMVDKAFDIGHQIITKDEFDTVLEKAIGIIKSQLP